MHPFRRSVIALTAVVACVSIVSVAEAQAPRSPLSLEPIGATGEAIWPAFEAWSRNEDGTVTLLLGYFNRNDEMMDVPIGEDNYMGPGGEDMGQPTHFLPGRNYGVFSVTVPQEQATQRLTWTIRVNNQPSEIAFTTPPEYFANPFLERATGNTPPVLRVGASGTESQGPSRGVAAAYTTTVGESLTLLLSASDQALATEAESPEPRADRRGGRRSPLSGTWKKFRGSGEVSFEAEGIDAGPELTHSFEEVTGGETMTTVTFSAPGQYRLMATGTDTSTGAGDGSSRQCCWTTVHVDVTVGP